MVTFLIITAFALVVFFTAFRYMRQRGPLGEETRRAVGEKILRDLLMLADVDTTAILPKPYRLRIERWLTVRDLYGPYWVATGRQQHNGTYRDLAKLLNDLSYPPIDEAAEVPLLPSSIQLRINRWLIQHRWAIEGRRPKSLSR